MAVLIEPRPDFVYAAGAAGIPGESVAGIGTSTGCGVRGNDWRMVSVSDSPRVFQRSAIFFSWDSDLRRQCWATVNSSRLELGIVQGEVAFDGFEHDALGQDDEIMPEAQGGLHSFEEGDDGGGEVDSVFAGHFEGVAQGFTGDAKLMGVVLTMPGEILGLFDEGVELKMDGLGEKFLDGIAGVLDFVAQSPP